jgi:hypothetical protein
MERAIRQKGQTVRLSERPDEECLCLGTHDLLRALTIRKEDITKALENNNIQTTYPTIYMTTIPTGGNPKQAYCIPVEKTELRQSDGLPVLTVSVPTPESVVNGRWVDKDPWDEVQS